MWTDETIKEYTRKCIDKCKYDTATAITMKSFYSGNTNNKFGETRAIVEKEIQIYKQNI